MTLIFFVGDGPRDQENVPSLVEKILGKPLETTCHDWPRLQGAGKGYLKKLRFAILQAKDQGALGLVATLDRDKDRHNNRMKSLRESRDQERAKLPAFPTALGQAIPHGEAWLLDDPAAVKEGLGLEPGLEIPTIRKVRNPKSFLDELIGQIPGNDSKPMELLKRIAQLVDPQRCRHAAETGFADFVEEVRRELKDL